MMSRDLSDSPGKGERYQCLGPLPCPPRSVMCLLDIADFERDDVTRSQPCAIGQWQRRLAFDVSGEGDQFAQLNLFRITGNLCGTRTDCISAKTSGRPDVTLK